MNIQTIFGTTFGVASCGNCSYPLNLKVFIVHGTAYGTANCPPLYQICCPPSDSILDGACAAEFGGGPQPSWDAIEMNKACRIQMQYNNGGFISPACTCNADSCTLGSVHLNEVGYGFAVGYIQLDNTWTCGNPPGMLGPTGSPGYWSKAITRVYGPYPQFCVQYVINNIIGSSFGLPEFGNLTNEFIYQNYGPVSAGQFIEIEPPAGNTVFSANLIPGNSGMTIGPCSGDDPPP